jgi:hypothetical protein
VREREYVSGRGARAAVMLTRIGNVITFAGAMPPPTPVERVRLTVNGMRSGFPGNEPIMFDEVVAVLAVGLNDSLNGNPLLQKTLTVLLSTSVPKVCSLLPKSKSGTETEHWPVIFALIVNASVFCPAEATVDNATHITVALVNVWKSFVIVLDSPEYQHQVA